MSRSCEIIRNARAEFKRSRAYWLRQAREYMRHDKMDCARRCVDSARIAHRNLLYISKEDA